MRYRKVLISGPMLIKLVEEGNEIHARCVKGLPEGTRFAYSVPDTVFGIWLVVQHDSFDELKSGDEIPTHPNPELEKII